MFEYGVGLIVGGIVVAAAAVLTGRIGGPARAISARRIAVRALALAALGAVIALVATVAR